MRLTFEIDRRFALVALALATTFGTAAAQHFVMGTQTGAPGARYHGYDAAVAQGPMGQRVVAVADPAFTTGTIVNRGRVQLFAWNSAPAASALRTELGNSTTDFFGASVAAIDDVDGDGWQDFAIGAPGTTGTQTPAGYVRFVSGNPTPPPTTWLPQTLVSPISDKGFGRGITQFAWITSTPQILAWAVVGAGEVHWVFLGNNTFSVGFSRPITATAASPIPSVPIGRLELVNSDVFGDLAVPTPAGIAVLSGADGTTLATIANAAPGFGKAMVVTGDVTGNGKNDLLIGAPDSSNGQAFLYEGGTWALRQTWTGATAGGQFGASVGVGDFDGDGTRDYLVGAPGSGTAAVLGTATLISGQTNLPLMTAGAPPGSSGVAFASKVAGFGDLDGNGYEDYLLSRPSVSTAAAATLVCSGGPIATVVDVGGGCTCSPGLPPRLLTPLGQRPTLGGTIQLTLLDNANPSSPAVLALGPAAVLPPCLLLNPISVTPGFNLVGGSLTTPPFPVGTSTALTGAVTRAQFAVAAQCGTAFSNALEFKIGL